MKRAKFCTRNRIAPGFLVVGLLACIAASGGCQNERGGQEVVSREQTTPPTTTVAVVIDGEDGSRLAGAILSTVEEIPSRLYRAVVKIDDLEVAIPELGDITQEGSLTVYFASADFTRRPRPSPVGTPDAGEDNSRRSIVVGGGERSSDFGLGVALERNLADDMARLLGPDAEAVEIDPSSYEESNAPIVEADPFPPS